jgi:hypothetical protein
MPRPRLSAAEERLAHRARTAELHAVYKQALVNGSQFRLADGSVKDIVHQIPINPKLLATCKHCGRSFERQTNAVRPRLFCDRSCSAAHRVKKLKAMTGKAAARARRRRAAPSKPTTIKPRTRKGTVYQRRHKKKPARR